jgi:multidrug efflux pump
MVRSADGTLVRRQDVARAELGAEDYDTAKLVKDQTAIFVGIEQVPGANPLTVAGRVHKLLPHSRAQLPEGLYARTPYDASIYINDAIHEVFRTLAEAVLIVLFVIFLVPSFIKSCTHIVLGVFLDASYQEVLS